MTTAFSTAFSTSFAAVPLAVVLPPLATRDDYLAGQPAGTVPPANLDELLAATSASIRRYCGWHIAPVITETVRLDGSGTTSQRLPTLHLLDVLAVDNAGIAVDVTALEWSADGFMRLGHYAHYGYGGGAHYGYGHQGWTTKLRGVSVTFTHGYDLADVGQLGALTTALVSRSVAAPHGYITGESVGSVQVNYGRSAVDDRPGSMTLLEYETEMLDSFRLPGRRSG